MKSIWAVNGCLGQFKLSSAPIRGNTAEPEFWRNYEMCTAYCRVGDNNGISDTLPLVTQHATYQIRKR